MEKVRNNMRKECGKRGKIWKYVVKCGKTEKNVEKIWKQ